MGVWIETSPLKNLPIPQPSHPSWVCGLKQLKKTVPEYRKWSHPSWVCGLKLSDTKHQAMPYCHTLRGCVDINEWSVDEFGWKVVCRNFRQTTQHGALEGKTQSKEVKYYNLDVIISVGYRVKTILRFMFRLFQLQHSSPSAIVFDSFGHRIRFLLPPDLSPPATAAVSFG